ncbi:hypothetical protein L227DRAFT_613125 [Lentinus tigrinus ALCF2SS1-6]|uniref:Fungal-type protein kinase domain-containing protein n=1 Tax=Lentinus tigrinus ALCF2SS1-6 TaxID=1328759 RepID=A0A5C2S3J2_9APHY|nr:hypothetical protein L227DRAFT_613125 [Lentinus tigrinus ALCF2SS1-6]
MSRLTQSLLAGVTKKTVAKNVKTPTPKTPLAKKAPKTPQRRGLRPAAPKTPTPKPKASNQKALPENEDPPAKAPTRKRSAPATNEGRPKPKKRKASAADADSEEADEVQDIDEEMRNPAYLDALVKLDPRASEATRRKNRYSKVYQAARIIGRYTYMVDATHCIAFLVAVDGTDDSDRPWGTSIESHEDDGFEMSYPAFINFLPGIERAIPVLKENPELIQKLGRYVEKVTGKTRSDDIVRLKPRIVQILGIPDPKYTLVEKSNRGFRHATLARLLTPKSKIDQYDADPEGYSWFLDPHSASWDSFVSRVAARPLPLFGFMSGLHRLGLHIVVGIDDSLHFLLFCLILLLDGKVKLWGKDWWMGLYDETLTVPGRFKEGFLKNPKLVEIYLYLFRSQNSAEHESITTKKKKGQPSLQEKYRLGRVSLPSILYTACIGRFCITGQTEWRDTDGAWNAREFVHSVILYAGSHKRWYDNILLWWDSRVYGDLNGEGPTDEEVSQTAAYQAMYESDDEESDIEGGVGGRFNQKTPSPSPAPSQNNNLESDDDNGIPFVRTGTNNIFENDADDATHDNVDLNKTGEEDDEDGVEPNDEYFGGLFAQPAASDSDEDEDVTAKPKPRPKPRPVKKKAMDVAQD